MKIFKIFSQYMNIVLPDVVVDKHGGVLLQQEMFDL